MSLLFFKTGFADVLHSVFLFFFPLLVTGYIAGRILYAETQNSPTMS